MTFSVHGIAVSSGIAIGHAHLLSHTSLEVVHYVLPKQFIDEEIARFDAALLATRTEFISLRSNRPQYAAAEFDAFLELHQMILDDPLLSVAPRDMIATEHCNAEWALKTQTEKLVAQFDEFEDAYLRERQTDVTQVAERLLKQLTGTPGHQPAPTRHDVETILVAHDLSPADLMQFRPQQFAAFITDVGGATSHTAIVARSLNTPCVVGLHHARELIREDDQLEPGRVSRACSSSIRTRPSSPSTNCAKKLMGTGSQKAQTLAQCQGQHAGRHRHRAACQHREARRPD